MILIMMTHIKKKISSVKLRKTLSRQIYIFLLILCSFSQVALHCYYLENISSAEQVNFTHNKIFFTKILFPLLHGQNYLYYNKIIKK